MSQIITKHKNRYKVQEILTRIKNIYIDTELLLPMYNAHPYFSLKNLGKSMCILLGKIPLAVATIL